MFVWLLLLFVALRGGGINGAKLPLVFDSVSFGAFYSLNEWAFRRFLLLNVAFVGKMCFSLFLSVIRMWFWLNLPSLLAFWTGTLFAILLLFELISFLFLKSKAYFSLFLSTPASFFSRDFSAWFWLAFLLLFFSTGALSSPTIFLSVFCSTGWYLNL